MERVLHDTWPGVILKLARYRGDESWLVGIGDEIEEIVAIDDFVWFLVGMRGEVLRPVIGEDVMHVPLHCSRMNVEIPRISSAETIVAIWCDNGVVDKSFHHLEASLDSRSGPPGMLFTHGSYRLSLDVAGPQD